MTENTRLAHLNNSASYREFSNSKEGCYRMWTQFAGGYDKPAPCLRCCPARNKLFLCSLWRANEKKALGQLAEEIALGNDSSSLLHLQRAITAKVPQWYSRAEARVREQDRKSVMTDVKERR